MGAGWWAVQGPGTNERTAMDPEPETQRSGANGEVISGTLARGGSDLCQSTDRIMKAAWPVNPNPPGKCKFVNLGNSQISRINRAESGFVNSGWVS